MFFFDDFYGKKVLKSTLLEGCEHFFTIREFVLASGSREDLQNEASSNVDFLIEKMGIPKENLYCCHQMHTNNVAVANGKANFFENTDGIVLTEKNTATFLNFADCIPIILFDDFRNIGAVVHAGWRGTAARIQQKAVKLMTENGSKPENIKAAIGAGIGKCCFDVNKDVFEEIFDGINKKSFYYNNSYSYNEDTDKYFVDLKLVNKMLLNEVSVLQIDISDYCTSCSDDIFFSYRKEKGYTARHSAVLKIKG